MRRLINADYVIEALDKHHSRHTFECGETALNTYLQKQARQDMEKRVAAVFVMTEKNDRAVIGFYTLSSLSVDLEDLPESIAKKLPKYPLVPATLLGRLAVDHSKQKLGLGGILLYDALLRSYQASQEIGSMAVLVDAKHNAAADFYIHYGFLPLPKINNRYFMPMRTIEKLIH